jgi:hypothetical protein
LPMQRFSRPGLFDFLARLSAAQSILDSCMV